MSDRQNFSATGNPRTLQTHKEMQMRDVQRGERSRRNPVADRSGLHTDRVVGVDSNGDVMLERFTDYSTGKGQSFSPLNFTPCRVGDTIIYAYADETPIVLGKMPDDKTPWRVPQASMQDTFFFHDMDILDGFWYQGGVTGGATITGSAGQKENPGLFILTTGGTGVGQYAYVHPTFTGVNGLLIEGLSQVGFGLAPSSNAPASVQILVGLTDHGINFTNYIVGIVNQGAPWNAQAIRTGITVQNQVTSIAYNPLHVYRIVMTKIAPGSWAISVTDVTDRIEETVISNDAPKSGVVYPIARIYPQVTTLSNLSVDYMWWSRRSLKR